MLSRHSAPRISSRCMRCVPRAIFTSRRSAERHKRSNSQRASASVTRPSQPPRMIATGGSTLLGSQASSPCQARRISTSGPLGVFTAGGVALARVGIAIEICLRPADEVVTREDRALAGGTSSTKRSHCCSFVTFSTPAA